jgi:hypothetical protein
MELERKIILDFEKEDFKDRLERDKTYQAIEQSTEIRLIIKQLRNEPNFNGCVFQPSKEIADKFGISRRSQLNYLLTLFENSLK